MPPEKAGRLAKLYKADEVDTSAGSTRTAQQHFSHAPDSMGGDFLTPPLFLESGGGLVSTASDYIRFAQMLVSQYL